MMSDNGGIAKAIKKEFGLQGLLLIPICVAINIVGFQICQITKIPLFLDCIGTILIGAIGGPGLTMITGLITNCINGVFNPVYFYYAPASMLIGLAAALCARGGLFKSKPKLALTCIIITIVNVITVSPITVLVFGGSAGSTSSVLTSVLLASGHKIWTSVMSTSFIENFVDKVISVIIVYNIARNIPVRFSSKLLYGKNIIPRTVDQSKIDELYN